MLKRFFFPSSMRPLDNTYQCMHARFLSNLSWRRKWPYLIIFTICVIFAINCIIILIVHQPSNIAERDAYLDDVPERLYQAVLRKWYNFSGGEAWYNKKDVSALSPERFNDLLTDIKRNWIISNYNPNESYVLQEPDVEDPSMGQSDVIREIFNDKKNGFFIECGAYDGEARSNTLYLERFNGWSGLLIEADPINFTKMLQKNRRAYISPTCLSITKTPTLASFLMAKNVGRLHEPENTTNAIPKNTPDVAYSGKHIDVQCFPLALYIATLEVETVDYFSLDIEGNEIDVLETIPFDVINIKALSVEHIHNAKGRKYMIDMMKRQGYYVHSFVERTDNLANDIIFVKHGT